MRKFTIPLLAALLALGITSGPALANNGNGQGPQNNSLRSQATPVDLSDGDVLAVGDFYAISHDLDYTDYVWCEPVRRGGASAEKCGVDEPFIGFDTLYLGISETGDPVDHTGQVSLYYDTDDGWKSIIAQFNGKGELLHVNGIAPQ